MFSPGQISWIIRHEHAPVFVVSFRHGHGLLLHHASQMRELVADASDVAPRAVAATDCKDVAVWDKFFKIITAGD